MSPSMLAGDCVLVDKCSGGARIFNVLKALDSKDVNIYRMPGWRNFKRNDVLVLISHIRQSVGTVLHLM